MATSPSGRYVAAASVLADVETGKGECVGGQECQKSVNLAAVDDEGRAYGLTGPEAGSSAQLVVAQAGQVSKVVDLPDGGSPPLGIMQFAAEDLADR